MSIRDNGKKTNLDEDYKELKNLEKKDDGFVDEKESKDKKAGAPISPLGGSKAYYFDTNDEKPDYEDVIALQFQDAGKIYWYYYPENKQENITENDLLVAYSERGMEIAKVLRKTRHMFEKIRKIDFIKNGIIRKATSKDVARKKELNKKAEDAMSACRELNRELGIRMKILRVKYTLDDRKIIFYYTANGRVDFRQLIKDLAKRLHRRIEMRQVGVRDGTKIRGGFGICGRELCCCRYIHDFNPVSISMAKRQNLSLNPKKLSGICGRLFCCLSYEDEIYKELRRKYPREGTKLFHSGSEQPFATVTKTDVIQLRFSAVKDKSESNRNSQGDFIQLSIEELDFCDGKWYVIEKEKTAPAVDEVDSYIKDCRDEKEKNNQDEKKKRTGRKPFRSKNRRGRYSGRKKTVKNEKRNNSGSDKK
ncbi:MAG: regulatory iron-sulfur-containing complex subunit RicT [bacterium]